MEGKWEVRYYVRQDGSAPIDEFLRDLPPKHRTKIRQSIGRLQLFGPDLGFPDTSQIKGTQFRELRTRFSGQQYRLLYIRDGDTFVVFVGFHKTRKRDLDEAVAEARTCLNDYRKG